MQIFISPEIVKEQCQILNIINQDQKAIGYITFFFDEKKMYVYGQCEEEGVSEDFKDVIQPYIQGMSKAKPDLDIYSYICIGGKKLTLNKDENNE
ncbi:hypothetical protein [Fredinandcohnia quinoae]|uniref:Uncharacterized protein n=1 Tax=Fredinandcohnia quinoae TaxID=2918902 RepID=A0AAW5E0D7_9BACI|nr:hypothetical protein [Fredinandcohnia sp. SECRCQ15]